jgi:uncharacterized protein
MNRLDVLNTLKSIEQPLRKSGIAALYLFGSYARDEAKQTSDIDVFIDPVDEDHFGLMPLMDSLSLIEKVFPDKIISYSTRNNIVPCYLAHIEHNAVQVF